MQIVQLVRTCDAEPVPFPAHGADRIVDVVIVSSACIKLSSGLRRPVVIRRQS